MPSGRRDRERQRRTQPDQRDVQRQHVATRAGGGLDQSAAGRSATLTNVTVANNVAYQRRVRHQRAARAPARHDRGQQHDEHARRLAATVSGPFNSHGFNLVFPRTGCGFSAATNDLLDVDPKLGPLQDNGGQVPTHALLPGSAAIDAGTRPPRWMARPGTAPPATRVAWPGRRDGDLDGVGRCDIGAYAARLVLGQRQRHRRHRRCQSRRLRLLRHRHFRVYPTRRRS